MKIISESHLDHRLSQAVINHVLKLFATRNSFFIATIELPEELGTVPCNIHGPAVGESPVGEEEAFFASRPPRTYLSRLCRRPSAAVRVVTVIAGPTASEACVLYTAYGGPLAPREPADPSLPAGDQETSRKFWAEHALGQES